MKILLTIISFFLIFNSFSQGKANNKLSADLNIGSTNPFSNLSKNYYANYVGFLHVDLGARYMFLEKIGVKLDLGFDRFQNDKFGVYKESLPFSSMNYRTNLQGILNIGKILRYSDWSKKIGLIAHGGFGVSIIKGDSATVSLNKSSLTDNSFNLIAGLSPQFKLTDKIALNLDLSFITNINQNYNFDFKNKSNNRYGMIANVSVGMHYYIGKHKTHYDWNFKKKVIDEPKDIIVPEIVKPIAADMDKDGVVDSLDVCPEEFGLADFEGCPKPEMTFDCDMSGYPVFTFKGARSEILESYKPYLDSIAFCLGQDKLKKLVIYGHTDKFGDSVYTTELSLSRANMIKKELVLRGISNDRIFTVGEGTKKALISEAEFSKIKHNRIAYFKTISNNQFDIQVLETGEYLQGLFYTIQIGAFKKVIKNNKFKKYGQVLVAKSTDGYTKYSIDIFTNYEDANNVLKLLKKNSLFNDAFIASYFLGERIPIKKAQELLLLEDK